MNRTKILKNLFGTLTQKCIRSKLVAGILSIAMVAAMIDVPVLAEGPSTTIIEGKEFYELRNADDLYWFADHVNSGDNQANAILVDDIIVNEGEMDENSGGRGARAWTPIGYWNSSEDELCYEGIFDGQGHTISGLYFNYSKKLSDCEKRYESIGLFGRVGKGGVVKNVTLKNLYFRSSAYEIGGIVGVNFGIIKNCGNEGTINSKGHSEKIGGIVGWNLGIVEGCNNFGKVIINSKSSHLRESNNAYHEGGGGGVVGYNKGGEVNNCNNYGTIDSINVYVGGVVGQNNKGQVKHCNNFGIVSSGFREIGGVVGENKDDGTVEDCNNVGQVSGESEVGGVVGWNNEGFISNCSNSGTVSGNYIVGGIVGWNCVGHSIDRDNNKCRVENCGNTAIIVGKNCNSYCIGGVVGCNGGKVKNCSSASGCAEKDIGGGDEQNKNNCEIL